MRLLICGDREWVGATLIENVLKMLLRMGPIECVIEGECRGADLLGRWAAERLGIPVSPFPAEWERYGKQAGTIRNRQMLIEGRPTHLIAFHNDIENSVGTKDMIGKAKAAGVPLVVISEMTDIDLIVWERKKVGLF